MESAGVGMVETGSQNRESTDIGVNTSREYNVNIGTNTLESSSNINHCPVKNVESVDGKQSFKMLVIGFYEQMVVNDRDFILCLIPRTKGRLLELFGQAIAFQWVWPRVQENIVKSFFPARQKEELVQKYLTRKFQSHNDSF